MTAALGPTMSLDRVRLLTVRQPWAWAIAAGHKTVENRTFGTRWRGTLLVHAGAGWSRRGASDDRVLRAFPYVGAWEAGAGMIDPALHGSTLAFRAVVAAAELDDVHPDVGCCRPWGEGEYRQADGRLRRDVWHWTLVGVRRLDEPVPAIGGLGLRRVGQDLAEACGLRVTSC